MKKRTKIIIVVAVAAVTAAFAVYGHLSHQPEDEQHHQQATRADISHLSTAEIPPMYFRPDNDIVIQDIIIYDLSLKLMALDFDDGPSEVTEQLLDVLYEAGVSATFYVTGRAYHDVIHEFVGARVHPGILRKTESLGHHIGSHSYQHPWSREQNGKLPEGQDKIWALYTVDEVLWQVEQLDEAVLEILGFTPSYYAPPYYYEGHNYFIGLTDKTIAFRNFAVDLGDWHTGVSKDMLVEWILSSPDNSTLVLHDVYQKTVDATREVLNSPEASDIQFVTSYELDMILGR